MIENNEMRRVKRIKKEDLKIMDTSNWLNELEQKLKC